MTVRALAVALTALVVVVPVVTDARGGGSGHSSGGHSSGSHSSGGHSHSSHSYSSHSGSSHSHSHSSPHSSHSNSARKTEHVSGHYSKSGKWVKPYDRHPAYTAPKKTSATHSSRSYHSTKTSYGRIQPRHPRQDQAFSRRKGCLQAFAPMSVDGRRCSEQHAVADHGRSQS
jgi:hypothetical protein